MLRGLIPDFSLTPAVGSLGAAPSIERAASPRSTGPRLVSKPISDFGRGVHANWSAFCASKICQIFGFFERSLQHHG
jgi:hypothetical protein